MKLTREDIDQLFGRAPGNIPLRWHNHEGHYFLYHGDILFGTGFFPQDHQDGRFVVVPRNHIMKIYDHPRDYQTLDQLKQIGHEVRSEKLVQHWRAGERLGVPDEHKTLYGGNPVKKMVVFGAGASAHCVTQKGKELLEQHPLRPPLGFDIFNEQFDDLILQHRGARQAVPSYEVSNKNIEEFYEDEWDKIQQQLRPDIAATHINIQFYLQALFSRISETIHHDLYRYSLYALFCKQLYEYLLSVRSNHQSKNEQVALVSFNYDTLLDQALSEKFNFAFTSLAHYSDNEQKDFLLFKPHGSCNWGWPVKKIPEGVETTSEKQVALATWLFEQETTPASIYYDLLGDEEMICETSYGTELDTATMLGKYTPNKNCIEVMQPGKPYLPALLLPYRDKDEFMLRYRQQTHLEHCMNEIEELVLIGWKGNEKLFNKKLKKHAQQLKRLVIVNPEPDAVKANILPFLPVENPEIKIVPDFETYVLQEMN